MKSIMKIIGVIAFSSLYAFSYDYNLKPKQITKNIHCFFGDVGSPNKINNGNMVNTCYINKDDFYIVIDSGPTYKYAHQVNSIMNKIAKLPVKYVFNSHTHDDHLGGNIFYQRSGSKIIGSEHIHEQHDDTRMEKMIKKEAFAGTISYLPETLLTKEKTTFGDMEAYIFENQAHTKSDLVIYDKKEKVVFVGDLAFNERVLSIRDGDINGWLSTLDKIEKLDFKHMITGHGHDTSIKAHSNTKEYLLKLKNDVRTAIDDGVEIDEAAKKLDFPMYKDKKLYNELHRKNIYKVYQQLEWE